MSAYLLGAKVLRSFASEQNHYGYFKAKLSDSLFKGDKEKEIFEFFHQHYSQYQQVPALETLESQFPEVKALDIHEPSAYYLKLIEERSAYNLINQANLDAQTLLTKDKKATAEALAILQKAVNELTAQQYRVAVLDAAKDVPELVIQNYYNANLSGTPPAYFGWPYMDTKGGVGPGNMVSFVGRPAMGKSYQMLYCALHNWRVHKQNVLFISMEMSALDISQRVAAMYAGTSVGQLKGSAFSTQTTEFFMAGMEAMGKEEAKFYIVDANLAATVESIYALASNLKCKVIFIDGAYMLSHPNERLNRFESVALNVNLIKQATTRADAITFCSWQFNRQAVQKGKGPAKGEKPGLEDIGFTDNIGMISSIVIGIQKDEGVETMQKRILQLHKGRNGESGDFSIKWDFMAMDFTQVDADIEGKPVEALEDLSFI